MEQSEPTFFGSSFMTVFGVVIKLLLLASCSTTENEKIVSLSGHLPGEVIGTVSYRECVALPPDAVVEIVLLDVSRMDVAATTITEQTIKPSDQVPIKFELVYDTAAIIICS